MLFCDQTDDGGGLRCRKPSPFTVEEVTAQDLILLMFSSMRVWI